MQTVGLLVLNKVTPYLTNAIIIEKLVMFMANVHILSVRHELGTVCFTLGLAPDLVDWY